MNRKIFTLKVLLLMTLLAGVVGVNSTAPAAAEEAEKCAKCKALTNSQGQVEGYGCVKATGATHRCVATVDGCDFPEGDCAPNLD